MSLVPRTFRFDKYQFHTRNEVEAVPRPEAIKPVDKSPKLSHQDTKQKPREGLSPEDRYGSESDFPTEWTQQYFPRRALWSPLDEREIRHGPGKILFLLEGDAFLIPLCQLAQEFITKYKSKIDILVVMEESTSAEKLIAKRKEVSAQIKKAGKDKGNSLAASQIHVLKNSQPHKAILREMSVESYSLLVMGRDNPQLVSALIKESEEPILILPHPAFSLQSLHRVMVPVEGTSFSYPAISQAIVLSEDFQSELLLFQVVEEGEQNFSNILEKMAWKNIKHDYHQGSGEISRTIVDFATQHQVDLLVMRTHSAPPGVVQASPSFTLEVMKKTDCALYVVQP